MAVESGGIFAEKVEIDVTVRVAKFGALSLDDPQWIRREVNDGSRVAAGQMGAGAFVLARALLRARNVVGLGLFETVLQEVVATLSFDVAHRRLP